MVLQATPHGKPAHAEASIAEKRFRALVDFLRTYRRPLIQLQHNPDPDALASGFGLKHLLKRVLHLDTTIAFTGSVGRAENRAMMRYLRIQIVPAYKVKWRLHDLVIVVDTHPGAGTCKLPEGVKADLVVDHHPGGDQPPGAAAPAKFSLVDPTYGATSTIVGEILLVNGVAIPQRVATALTYGIETDTAGLARHVSPADERVFAALHAMADKKLLGRIQRARVPQAYFQALERGLRAALVHDRAVTAHLGEVAHPDLVAEVADLLFRLEAMRWSFVTGRYLQTLYASIRALDAEGHDAGAVARKVAGPKGSGGGHEALAAAQIPIPAGTPPEEVHRQALERFLDAIGATKRSLTRSLTLPPEATPPTATAKEDKKPS